MAHFLATWIRKIHFFIPLLKLHMHFYLSVFLVLNSVPFSVAQEEKEQTVNTEIAPLFTEEEPLELVLTADFQTLLKTKDADEPEYYPAQLNLNDPETGNNPFELKIKARGISRRNFDFCTFPPLLLNFKKKETKGTVFEGQNKLKLVTFCKDVNTFEEYVLKEYLAYKIFNIITDTSLQVRLVHITYQDSAKQKLMAERYGFLIEDIDHLARRVGGKEVELSLPHHDLCDRASLDRFMIFQYMIGNTDWWIAIPVMHNVKLISINSGPPIPIPFDFDYSGLVDADYAVPSEKLPIKAVTQRYFRGFCRMPGIYEKTIRVFLDRKEKVYDLIQNFPYCNDVSKKVMVKYMDQFYDVISDPKQVERRIYDACELQHKHLHEF
jgi:hypothetical protein